MAATDSAGARRKSCSVSQEEYERTIRPLVALHYKEIIRFGVQYAAAWLRRPKSKHQAHLSDLLPSLENAKDIAAEAFVKLLSGDRRDWDGDPETLQRAIGSCINSILSGRMKRDDNVYTTYLDDYVDNGKLEWLFSRAHAHDPDLQPAEEYANRYPKARLIQRLLPAAGYEDEGKVLACMITHRAFDLSAIARLTAMTEARVSQAFLRFAAYTQTDEFAIRLTEVFGDSVARPIPQNIHDLAKDVVRVRFGRK